MKQITDYEVHQQLTFLYLAFAHQTDFDLSDKEFKYITDVFTFKAAKSGKIDLKKLTSEIEKGYSYVKNPKQGSEIVAHNLKVDRKYKLIVQGTYWVIAAISDDSKNYDYDVTKEEVKDKK